MYLDEYKGPVSVLYVCAFTVALKLRPVGISTVCTDLRFILTTRNCSWKYMRGPSKTGRSEKEKNKHILKQNQMRERKGLQCEVSLLLEHGVRGHPDM